MGWFATRGDEARLTTRYLPKRHAELVGGRCSGSSSTSSSRARSSCASRRPRAARPISSSIPGCTLCGPCRAARTRAGAIWRNRTRRWTLAVERAGARYCPARWRPSWAGLDCSRAGASACSPKGTRAAPQRRPPLATSFSPVSQRASSEARNTAIEGDVVRLADAAERCLGNETGFHLRSDDAGGVRAFGLDHAGKNRVDADLARAELIGEHAGDRVHRALAAGIDGRLGGEDGGHGGGDVDDAGASPRCLAAACVVSSHAEHVDVEHPAILVLGHVLDRRERIDPLLLTRMSSRP